MKEEIYTQKVRVTMEQMGVVIDVQVVSQQSNLQRARCDKICKYADNLDINEKTGCTTRTANVLCLRAIFS